MQARFGPCHLEPGAHRRVPQALHQPVPSFFIEVARPVQVPFPMALLDEAPQGVLLKPGYGGGLLGKPLAVDGQKAGGQHQIGDADRRGDAAGKGTGVDDAPTVIGPLQGRDGPPAVAEFTVVIVLHQKTALLCRGPVEQLRPAACGHHRACGVLVGRGHIGALGAAFFQGPDGKPALVHRQMHHGPAAVFHGLPGFPVARLFHSIQGLLGEQAAQHHQQVFHARAQQHLLGQAAHAPELVEIAAQSLAQA